MMNRNIWFQLAKEKTKGEVGVRPNTNKFQRFQVVVPWFKAKRMFFPLEWQNRFEIQEIVNELSLVSPGGFKSKHDDCLDGISQLQNLRVWQPGGNGEDNDEDWPVDAGNNLDSYVC
jgi:phage terminase large subunit-like protein